MTCDRYKSTTLGISIIEVNLCAGLDFANGAAVKIVIREQEFLNCKDLLDSHYGDCMKYYDEEKMIATRKAFEAEVLTWKGVSSRPMMGCLCYFYNRKFIGFLVTDGIVLMKLSEKDQTVLKEKFGGKPFEMAGQTGRLWVTPLKGPKDVRSVMPFVRKRYDEVLSTSAKT
jgi:hypothetical protein